SVQAEPVMPVGLEIPSPPSARPQLVWYEFRRVPRPGSEEECRSSIQPEALHEGRKANPTRFPRAPPPPRNSRTKHHQLCPGTTLNSKPLSSLARAWLKKKKLTWTILPQPLNPTPWKQNRRRAKTTSSKARSSRSHPPTS